MVVDQPNSNEVNNMEKNLEHILNCRYISPILYSYQIGYTFARAAKGILMHCGVTIPPTTQSPCLELIQYKYNIYT